MKNGYMSIKEAGLYDASAARKSAKVRITIYLDLETLKFFKDKAKKQGEPYQTLINSFLNRAVKK